MTNAVGKYWKLVQLQLLKGDFANFHDQFSRRTILFSRNFKNQMPESIGILLYFNNRICVIFFEYLEQVINEQHKIVPSCIGIEFIEW